MFNARQMPLSFAPSEAAVVVTALAGCAEMKRRLADLGILIGSRVRLMNAAGCGPVIVAVGPARVAIGREMARKILVAPLDGG